MLIPSPRQIDRHFRQDVANPDWRNDPKRGPSTVAFRGPQKDLFDYLMRLARGGERRHQQTLDQIKTPAQVLARARYARAIFRKVQGLEKFPPRTPLHPVSRAGYDGPSYRVEHIILESRPHFFVVGNLYLPTQFTPPWPAVLYVEGHSSVGKAFPPYQRDAAVLAAKGLATFIVDPPGQGERDEYVDQATGQRTVGRACRMHGVAGDPAYLVGSNFGGVRLWDCIRCVDYLRDRADIIASRIGVAGRSGGGWESLWLGAIDTRIRAVCSHNYLTTWRRRMEDRHRDAEPDPEQDPFGLLAHGLEASDLLVACLPRAVACGATTGDFFPIDGARRAVRLAKRLFALAGTPERLGFHVSEGGHTSTLSSREFTYRWMLRWLKDDPAPDGSEPEVPREDEPATFCTRSGIVLTSLGGRTSAQLTAFDARDLALGRKKVFARQSRATRSRRLRQSLVKPLRFEPVVTPMRVQKEIPQHIGDVTVAPLRLLTSDRFWLTAHLWQPAAKSTSPRPATICLTEKPGAYDPLKNDLCRQLAQAGGIALDLDPRGMGPLDEAWLGFVPLLESSLTYDAFLLGRPVLGIRVADVLRGVDFLLQRNDVDASRLTVYGHEYGALLALFAATLDRRIGRVIEHRPLTSYASLTWNRSYAWAVNVVLPEVLKHLDLEDLRANLAPRPLTVIDPLDHLKQALTSAIARQEYSAVRRAYRASGAAAHFAVTAGEPNGWEHVASACLNPSA